MRRTWGKQLASLLVGTWMVSVATVSFAAAPPNIITYQGRVLDTNGVPVADASVSMKFFLYSALSGGTCVWSNSSSDCDSDTPGSTTAKSISLSSGLFTVNLGDTSDSYASIPDSVFADNSGIYLEVEIAGETLSPRRRLTAAPYALNAQRLDGIDSTGFLASDGDTASGDFDFSAAVLGDGSPLVFEGATANDFETTFAITDPTADRTITFQNGTGTVAFLSDIGSGGEWEDGTNGIFEDDEAAIVGTDIAFTYATGGIGDLMVADELEVLGDGFFDNDLVIGASTASTETLANTSFALGGDDLFVAGTVGVEGAIYTDGGFVAGTDTTFGSGLITTTGTTDLLLTIAGGDLTFAQNTTIGDGGDTIAFDTSDWDISTTGDFTNVGSITADGAISTTSTLDIDGATTLDQVTIDTDDGAFSVGGTNTITLGDNSGTVSINSSDWDISTTGDLTGIGSITMDGDITVGGDNIDSDGGPLTINATAADEVRIGTGTPGSATGTGDLYVTNDLEVDGTLSFGTLSCTDCIDFDELSDTMSLDASTSFVMDGAETFMIENGGTGDIAFNLQSTGELEIQDNGTPYFTFGADRSLDYTSNQTTTDAFDITVDSITTGQGVDISADALTTGAGLHVASTSTGFSSGQVAQIEYGRTFTTTETIGGTVLQVQRNVGINALGETVTNTGDLAQFTSAASATQGTVADTGDVVQITQASGIATGAALRLINNGTGDGVNIDQNGEGDAFKITTDSTTSTPFNLTASSTTTAAIFELVGGNFTDDSGVAFDIDVTEDTATADIFRIETDAGSANNQVFRIEADGDVISDIGFTASGTTYYDNTVTAGGTLTLDSSGVIQLGEDDDLLPQLGAGDADIGASGTRWDNVFATAGNFAGTVTVDDLSCTDCLDFDEFSDTLALDASTSITMDGAEEFSILNTGTEHVRVDLQSTGDFVIQDNGAESFRFTDAGTFVVGSTAGGIDMNGVRFDLDADNDTFITADTDDQIDIAIAGTDQIVFQDPGAANHGSSIATAEFNVSSAAHSSGTNTDIGLFIDAVVPDATGGTNSLNLLQIGANDGTLEGDADVTTAGIRIDEADGTGTMVGLSIGDGWDAGVSFDGSFPVVEIDDGSSLEFRDANGNSILSIADVSTSGSHVFSLDSDTAFRLDSDSDDDTDITTASNERLVIEPNGTGDVRFKLDSDSVAEFRASGSAPTGDLVQITNFGFATTTPNSNALSVTHAAENATTDAFRLTGGFTGGATNDLTYAAISVADIGPTNAVGQDNVIAIDIEDITDPGSTIKSQGLRIGDGFDVDLYFLSSAPEVWVQNGEDLAFKDDAGNTLMTLEDDGTTGTLNIDQFTNTGSNIDLYDNATTKTIDIGGILSDGTDTIRLATNNTSADTITIGNDNTGTTVDITGGDDWSIDATGTATFTLASSGSTAVCHNSGELTDCAGAPSADYAEMYPVEASVGYGDIVVPGTQQVTTMDGDTIVQMVKSYGPYQGPIVGIVVDNYGDFTSAGYNIESADNPMPVALVGRVPVKVTDEGGSISVGDYLTTSSTNGHAMKATKAGRVIGMAIEDWDGVSSTVMVQVNNSFFNGDVLGRDGISSFVTDNVVVSQTGTATSASATFDSYGLALRGSAWNGSEAEAVEMILTNTVDANDEYRLSIRNTAESEVAYITNEGTMRIAGDMVVGGRIYPSDRGTPQTDKYIFYDGAPGPAGDFMRTNAKGWATGSYDFAEMFPSNEALVAGDIVAFDGTGESIKRATGNPDERLAGIVSTRPGFLAGHNVEGAYPIALAGRVPTKVSLENGAIAVGDPLTASNTAGVAMKATDAGQIVGYALEAYDGTGDGLILGYVNVGYWSGGPQTIIVENTASQAPSSSSSFSALNMSGNIYMATHQILSIGRLEGVSNIWSIETDGTMKTQGLVKTVIESYQGTPVETIAVTSPEAVITLSGTATLDAGTAEVRFESVAPAYNDVISADAPIRVVVTPAGPASLYVSQKDNNHFVVERFAGTEDVAFDWMVTAYRKGFEPAAEDTVAEEEVEESAATTEDELETVVEADGETTETDIEDERMNEEASSLEEEAAEEETVDEPADEVTTTQTESVVEEEPATPESPEETIIDTTTEDDVDAPVEPPSQS